jgi:hypothetical protein
MHYRQWRLQDAFADATAIAGIKPNLWYCRLSLRPACSGTAQEESRTNHADTRRRIESEIRSGEGKRAATRGFTKNPATRAVASASGYDAFDTAVVGRRRGGCVCRARTDRAHKRYRHQGGCNRSTPQTLCHVRSVLTQSVDRRTIAAPYITWRTACGRNWSVLDGL